MLTVMAFANSERNGRLRGLLVGAAAASAVWSFPKPYQQGLAAGRADALAGGLLDEELGRPPALSEQDRAWWQAGYYAGFALHMPQDNEMQGA